MKTRAERECWHDPSGARARSDEASHLFEVVATSYADTRDGRANHLGEQARTQLELMCTMSVGNNAPEIDGEDLEGRRMCLSDYRGKVVVLSFWGNWCTLCVSMYPYEQSLVETMRGRPFVMLGVNSDNQIDGARSVVKDATVSWRSWRDGGEVYGGAIARAWSVLALPDFFIIDAQGVIRHRVGPHGDDHSGIYSVDSRGEFHHRWKSAHG